MVRHSSGGAGVDLRREEVEQLARAAAERMLSPRERADANSPPPPPPRTLEPTIEERFAAIDRRAAAFAQEQRRALVMDALDTARARFVAAVEATTDEQVRAAAVEVARYERLA